MRDTPHAPTTFSPGMRSPYRDGFPLGSRRCSVRTYQPHRYILSMETYMRWKVGIESAFRLVADEQFLGEIVGFSLVMGVAAVSVP